jgi:hypothetical protein
MTTESDWRPMSPEQANVIRTIVSRAGISHSNWLIEGLKGAHVRNSAAAWILDVRPSSTGHGHGLPDGPFPARAFVPSQASYRGEVIIWLTSGRLSGLEYACVTDEPPTRWPRPDEMEVVPKGGVAP